MEGFKLKGSSKEIRTDINEIEVRKVNGESKNQMLVPLQDQ